MCRTLALHGVLIWVSGPEDGGNYYNRAWLEFTGRTLEQEAGKGWTSGLHPKDQSILEAYSVAFADRKPATLEYRLSRHDGQWRWMEDNSVRNFGGGATQRVR